MEANRPPSRVSGPDLGANPPHLADYWSVVGRRIWVVVLIFGVTTASFSWAVPRTWAFDGSGVVPGALLGLILGVGAAFVLENRNRTIRARGDLEALLGIPVLGLVPRLRASEEENGEDGERDVPLVVAHDPLDPGAEAYRNLRMNLTFMSAEGEPAHTLLVAGPGPSEGRSTTAVNLAVMLTQRGKRVLLVDADLRSPALHRALGVPGEPGLTNILAGDADPREAIRADVLPNLDVLPSGPLPPDPSELLHAEAAKRVMAELPARYDQVVVDSPPLLSATDASVLAVHTDGVLLVVRSGETEQRAARRSVDQLRHLDVRIFGAVLNGVPTGASEDSYYLQYYYAYEPDRGPLSGV